MDKESKINPTHKYETTITYLKHFETSLGPNHLFWPPYSHEKYMKDINSTIWVTPKEIEEIQKIAEAKVKKDANKLEMEVVETITKQVIEQFGKSKAKSGKTQPGTNAAKYLISAKTKKLNAKKIFKFYETDSSGNIALRNRIQTKYGINEDTAKAWL